MEHFNNSFDSNALAGIDEEVTNFIDKSIELNASLPNYARELNRQIDAGEINTEYAKKEFNKAKAEAEQHFSKANDLKSKVQSALDKEVKYLSEQQDKHNKIDANGVAELMLLESLEVDQTLLNKYAKRYGNNELGRLKLKEIAKKNKIIGLELPVDKVEKAKEYGTSLISKVTDYSKLDTHSGQRPAYTQINRMGLNGIKEQAEEYQKIRRS